MQKCKSLSDRNMKAHSENGDMNHSSPTFTPARAGGQPDAPAVFTMGNNPSTQ